MEKLELASFNKNKRGKMGFWEISKVVFSDLNTLRWENS